MKEIDMQQELIEMLDEIIQYVEVWYAIDKSVLDRAEALLEKVKSSAKEPAVPHVELRPEDFTVEVIVTPMGGFAPNVTHGVRVTHKPTGLSVSCDTERSQHKNRHIAFEQITAMLTDISKATP